jgi:TPR repeat protein
MYLRGGGGAAPNPGEGYKWLLRAAEKQDSAAIRVLAELKEEG